MKIQNSYDLIILGAGIAGVSAAIKAGRMGAKVLLIENLGFLGGMSSAGMVSPFMKHSVNGQPLVEGIFKDLENEMRKQKGMIDNGFYANSFRNSSFNLISDSNVTILFNCEVLEVLKHESTINSIILFVYGQKISITGKIFIDTSGDALLVYLGGFPFIKGDENTGKMQALTLFFRINKIDMPKALDYVKKNKKDFFDWMDYDFDLNKIISVAGYFSNVKKAVEKRMLSNDVKYIFFTTLPSSGEASFNTSNVLGLDGSNSFDLTKAELIGRKQVDEVVNLLFNEIPGFENANLLETAVQVGVRETRRAIGDYVITGKDIKEGQKFKDAIARGCYGIDIHGQTDDESRMEDLKEGEYYEIPLGSLIVKDAKNLLVAGRCISATHEGHSALRIMPTSAATGEACGTLAALAIKENKKIREIDYIKIKSNLAGNI